MKNKKGIGFPEFFIVAVLITVPFLILAVHKQLNASGRILGDQQLPLIAADNERDWMLYIIDKNAEKAFDETLIFFDERSGFAESVCGRNWNEGCAVLNTKENPQNLCYPNMTACLNKIFTRQMNNLNLKSGVPLLIYRFIPYELFIQGSIIRGVALDDIEFDLASLIKDVDIIGEFSFKPSFTIIKKNELSLYSQIHERLERIYEECKVSQDLKLCSDDRLINDDVIESSSQVNKLDSNLLFFKFSFKEFDRQTCYALYFPTLEQRGLKI